MKIFIKTTIIILISVVIQAALPLKYDLIGKIESKRKNKIITVILQEKPEKEQYLIINNNNIIGKLKILSINSYNINQITEYKAVAEYSLYDRNTETLKAGMSIGLVHEQEKEKREYGEIQLQKEKKFKKQIISSIDNREMILIPEGKFVFGSNTGDEDEKPQSVVFLDNFYIDKYEVSNSDYYNFVININADPPVSWKNGKYPLKNKDLPVIVTFHEADEYAKWAKKRLPTEREWEKAARGIGLKFIKQHDESFKLIPMPITYPWGNKFDPLKANCREFWEQQNTTFLKKYERGLLPVTFFKNKGISPFGIVSMAGNASEWTSSWYDAYKDNKYKDHRFGTQVKVIRGGSWFHKKFKLRASSRSIGGLPNLYSDNIAGFRCVKDTSISDIDENSK